MQENAGDPSHDVVLEDGNNTSLFFLKKKKLEFASSPDIDPPFSPRIVTIKKNKSVTDEYQLMEILGR